MKFKKMLDNYRTFHRADIGGPERLVNEMHRCAFSPWRIWEAR
jgi:hypothetical protein